MKKIKLFIIQILLFACLIISNSFSKALPPGSGDGDVPANILILLDKSGSMNSYDFYGEEHLFEGTVNGVITTSQSGAKGFGYDPIFSPNGFNSTFAEMDAPTKNDISHRGLAIKKLVAFLKAN